MSAARFIVGGKVQGVWFRAATREQALKLDLGGYAKNLPDGQVEVLACGTDEAIATLEHWLWRGPPLADVQKVSREAVDPAPALHGFYTA